MPLKKNSVRVAILKGGNPDGECVALIYTWIQDHLASWET